MKITRSDQQTMPVQEVGNQLAGFLTGFLEVVVNNDLIEMVAEGDLIGRFV